MDRAGSLDVDVGVPAGLGQGRRQEQGKEQGRGRGQGQGLRLPFSALVSSKQVGQQVLLQLLRGGQQLTLTATYV